MIFVVKKQTNLYKNFAIKLTLLSILIGCFAFFYLQMSNQFQSSNDKLAKQLKHKEDVENKKLALNMKVENTIYKEAKSFFDSFFNVWLLI
ncbi:MAG: hypothetical protein HY307_00815 [Arcobacter sp.]|nr:hypothetical protein [Arcobacter sp.]